MHLQKSCTAAMVAVLLVVGAPAHASGTERVRDVAAMARSRVPALVASVHAVGPGAVRVRGRSADARGAVAIQRRGEHGWHVVARTLVRRHRFDRSVRQATPTATYRVVGRRAHTRSLVARVVVSAGKALPTAPSDRCGVRPRKADGTLWSCTFDDEFSGTVLDRTKWVPQTIFTSGTAPALACYRDDPSNVAVGGGTLNLTVRREAAPVPCAARPGETSPYTAGMVSTYHLFSQQYGRFEVRMKSPDYAGPGLQDDFWLWPDDRYPSTAVWPAAGEIDAVEHYSSHNTLDIPFLHYGANANLPGVTTAWNCSIKPGAFNTYTLTWSASRLEIDVNGAPCLINTSGDAAFRKPYIVALTQGLGAGANALTESTPLPATMQVDYVRVWS